ncbi:MAG: DUF2059 domain-containing protein [bacterium]|nr:DUF2059 domain-containing protein [bacterium]
MLLLNAMGVRDQTGPALNRQLEKFQQLHPDVPHDFWREQYKRHVEAKLMINGMAEVIEEDFAEAEVEALLDFYQSPVGMRMVELRVRLGKIAGPLGKRLGRLFSSEIRVELEKRGYLK